MVYHQGAKITYCMTSDTLPVNILISIRVKAISIQYHKGEKHHGTLRSFIITLEPTFENNFVN